MKRLFLLALLTVVGASVSASPSNARGAFGLFPCLGCRKCCCTGMFCIRQYNAFTPVCCGDITSCCGFNGWGGWGQGWAGCGGCGAGGCGYGQSCCLPPAPYQGCVSEPGYDLGECCDDVGYPGKGCGRRGLFNRKCASAAGGVDGSLPAESSALAGLTGQAAPVQPVQYQQPMYHTSGYTPNMYQQNMYQPNPYQQQMYQQQMYQQQMYQRQMYQRNMYQGYPMMYGQPNYGGYYGQGYMGR